MEGHWWNVRWFKAALIFPEWFSRLALMWGEQSLFRRIDISKASLPWGAVCDPRFRLQGAADPQSHLEAAPAESAFAPFQFGPPERFHSEHREEAGRAFNEHPEPSETRHLWSQDSLTIPDLWRTDGEQTPE